MLLAVGVKLAVTAADPLKLIVCATVRPHPDGVSVTVPEPTEPLGVTVTTTGDPIVPGDGASVRV